jgi:hypothetical protein
MALPIPGPDLQDHTHRALTQLVRVLPLCWHDSASSQGSEPQIPGAVHTPTPTSPRPSRQPRSSPSPNYWNNVTGSDAGLLVFDSQLTTYKIVDQLSGRRIRWLTLRQRGKTELARLEGLPAREWKTVTIARSGRYRRPRLHEDMIKLTDISGKVRQIAVKNIGRGEPTLLITNDLTTAGKNLFARYAERMMVENELGAYISGFHLNALTSGVPLNVDLDTTLTVVAGNLYRLLALKLSRYERATPETLWRDFLDATGTLHIDDTGVTCVLNLRSHHPP